jgi:hypothetical protein
VNTPDCPLLSTTACGFAAWLPDWHAKFNDAGAIASVGPPAAKTGTAAARAQIHRMNPL